MNLLNSLSRGAGLESVRSEGFLKDPSRPSSEEDKDFRASLLKVSDRKSGFGTTLKEKMKNPEDVGTEEGFQPMRTESGMVQESAPSPGSKQTEPGATSSQEKSADPPDKDGLENESSLDSKLAALSASKDREQVILDFMDSFESEFRIPPETLVAAMTRLDPRSLNQSPELTAHKIIEGLPIREEAKPRALTLYNDLLRDLSQISPRMETPSKSLNQSSLAVLGLDPSSLALDQRLKMQSEASSKVQEFKNQFQGRVEGQNLLKSVRNERLQSLNDKFWMKDLPSVKGLELPGQEQEFQDVGLEGSPQGEFTQGEFTQGEVKFDPNASPALEASNEDQKLSSLQALWRKKSNENLEGERALLEAQWAASIAELKPKEKTALKEFLKGNLEAHSRGEATELQSSDLSEPEWSPTPVEASASRDHQDQSSPQGRREFTTSAKVLEKSPLTEKDFRQIGDVLATQKEHPSLPAERSLGPLAVSVPAQEQELPSSVKAAMDQAQYLIKKGGGEMTVQMSPEGLGELHVRVVLHEGRAQVSLLAETPEAKKIIENSASELRNHLQSQKISLEGLRVDLVGSAGSDLGLQSQTSSQGQQSGAQGQPNLGQNQRDSTQQFWNNFQENFGHRPRRDGYLEQSGKITSSKRTQDPLTPLETVKKPRRADGRGQGLNLVA